jgi:hypothetical protein
MSTLDAQPASSNAAQDFPARPAVQVWLGAMSARCTMVLACTNKALLTFACCFVCAAVVPMCSSLRWHSCCSLSSSCGACCVLSSRPLLTHHGLYSSMYHQQLHQAEVACLSACMRIACNCPAATSQHSCSNRSLFACAGASCAGAVWSAAAVAAATSSGLSMTQERSCLASA